MIGSVLLWICGGFLLLMGCASWERAGEVSATDRDWYRWFGLTLLVVFALCWRFA